MPNSKHFYRLGDLTFSLEMPDLEEKEELALFRTAPCEADESFSVTLADAIPEPTGELLFGDPFTRYYRTSDGRMTVFRDERSQNDFIADMAVHAHHSVLLHRDFVSYINTNLVLKLLNFPRRVIAYGGIFLHASFIDVGGEAILFTGPKQMGKSTEARLWEQHRGAEVINGDRALLRKRDGRWYAFGSPYCGTSKICKNRELPIRAIVILSKAPENRAARAGVARSLSAMLDGCSFDTWDKEQMERVTDICGTIVTEVPFYTLACRPDEGAVEALEREL